MDVIIFANVYKSFVVLKNQKTDLKSKISQLFGAVKIQKTEFVVIENVSFKIKSGEFIGIMGRNGAGKSTILKMIAGVYTPTNGKIILNGHVAPVLELGAGFAPDLDGLENIYLNASILGFSKKRIKLLLNSIIEFSELGEHIHQPVRNYSSGMLVRLAFSIVVHLESPIMLFDEVLAVGDAGFQKKCLNKIDELHKSGKTIILVTHSPGQVAAHCKRCIVIDAHKIIFDGDANEGVLIYDKLFDQ